MEQLKRFLAGLFYEDGKPSRTGLVAFLMSLVPLLVWTLITLYLAFSGKVFQYYDTMTMGVFGTTIGGGVLQGVNKSMINRSPTLQNNKSEV